MTHLRFTIRDLLWLTLVVAVAIHGCRPGQRDMTDPLPPLADVESIEIDCDEPSSMGQPFKFVVPPEHWKNVLDALRPAFRDDNPAKWVWLGKATITRKAANPAMVFLFEVSEGPGAFAVGKKWEDRIYYRGGDSAKLKTAIESARSN